MKNLRTALITFGMTTLLYGAFALLTVAIDPAFAGRSIYQLFRDTGFPALVIGIACLLAVLLIAFAYAAFRGDVKPKRAPEPEDDEEEFLAAETVPAAEYDRPYRPVRTRRAPEPELFADDADEEPMVDETLLRRQGAPRMQHCIFCGTSFPAADRVCPKCGKQA